MKTDKSAPAEAQILLLYHHVYFPWSNASTIMEHVNSFKKYSRFNVQLVNTELGFPKGLSKLHFPIIILHYSLFGSYYLLNRQFLEYLKKNESSYKIIFFQDEHHYCQQRFDFLNDYKIDCVYSLLDPRHYKDVYQKYTHVGKIMHTLTGYVPEDLEKQANKFMRPIGQRTVDIGYRGRQLSFYMGRGSQEKYEIAGKFKERAAGLDLKLDIETKEQKRLYGDAWYRFLGNCIGCLGTEAGVSIFDVEDKARTGYEALIAANPKITFEEMTEKLLAPFEDNIYYRTISPRIFEAAAFNICQILYEGEYQGILKPMIHYIPLKKDFSNFDEVIRRFKDPSVRQELTSNCYRDLIASGTYTYQKFIDGFDEDLMKAGFKPSSGGKISRASFTLNFTHPLRVSRVVGINLAEIAVGRIFPGISRFKPLLKIRDWLKGRN